jgi:hypothetical protein
MAAEPVTSPSRLRSRHAPSLSYVYEWTSMSAGGERTMFYTSLCEQLDPAGDEAEHMRAAQAEKGARSKIGGSGSGAWAAAAVTTSARRPCA